MSAFADQPFIVIAGPCVIEKNRGENNRRVAAELVEITKDLPIEFYFKSSFDKANRTSLHSYRGPGLDDGLAVLQEIKSDLGVRLLTDVHEIDQVAPAAEVVDMLQIPAFLCRQTDLLVAAARTGKAVNIKKGQFMAPADMAHAAAKVKESGNNRIYITERGSSFGYNNLVVDMRSIPITQSLGFPLIFDATHSVQIPGGQGTSSGGKREFAPVLARAAVAAGANGLFFETHFNPDEALSDGPNMIPLAWVRELLETCLAIREVVQKAGTPLPAIACGS
ncbi:MAG: 3-deoxy-8-phosphooctulonate synthase [Candidatus Melainabacteria bacterium]